MDWRARPGSIDEHAVRKKVPKFAIARVFNVLEIYFLKMPHSSEALIYGDNDMVTVSKTIKKDHIRPCLNSPANNKAELADIEPHEKQCHPRVRDPKAKLDLDNRKKSFIEKILGRL